MNQEIKLKNGMRVQLVPFEGTQATTVLVLTKIGSRYEPDNLWGASHFIEHLMFKGTERRPTTMDISRELDRYGAEFNAFTGKDLTGYYVKIDKEKTGLAVDLLHDMIFNSLYDVEEMDRERKVIIEEIKMYEENPIMHIDDLLEQTQFAGNRLGKNIAGDAESMMKMKREDIIEFRDQNYSPENMVVVVAGSVPENVQEILEKTFGEVQNEKSPLDFEGFDELPKFEKPEMAVQSKELEQIQLAIGFSIPGRFHEDRFAIALLAKLMGGMMSSRLFIEVRERRGLCYSVRADASFYDDIGSFSINAGLDASRIEEATKTIFDELVKIKNEKPSEEELNYVKDNLAGGLKLKLENSSVAARFFGRQALHDKEILTPEEMLEKYKAVTAEDIQRVARDIFNEESLSVAAIGPYKNVEDLRRHIPVLK